MLLKNHKIHGRSVYGTGEKLEGPCIQHQISINAHEKGCWQKTDYEEAASEGLNENKENIIGKMEEEASL